MGCFNETCAITHTPILYDEVCWMVIVNDKFLTDLGWRYEFPDCYWKGTYKGKYNDYGWLQNQPDRIDGVISVFVSKNAAQLATKLFKRSFTKGYKYVNALKMDGLFKGIDRSRPGLELRPFWRETMCFVALAQTNRCNLFGGQISQNTTEDYKIVQQIQELANNKYKALLDQEAKDDLLV